MMWETRGRLRHKQRDREEAMKKWLRAAAAVACLAISGMASAQTFPAKPVHLLVPYPAGGAVDVLTRALGDVVAKTWGQTVIVENRPGAGGVIASQALAAEIGRA